jgi:serine protease Do
MTDRGRRWGLAAGVAYLAAWSSLGLLMSAPASAQTNDVATLAALRPSVVPVGTYDPTAAPRFGFRGSGFVVDDGRWVVTNFHVLPGAGEPAASLSLMVQAPRGRGELEARAATLVASDRTHDLALLRIEGDPLPATKLGSVELVPEGTPILLAGFPIGGALGFTPVMHRGMVASVTGIALPAPTARSLSARALTQLREGAFDIYQLDATAYPGNSGGPVVHAQTGEVLAVVNMVLVRGTRETALSHPTGISYAIPVRYVHDLLKQR